MNAGKESSQSRNAVAIYCRVSKEEQHREGRSLENQKGILRRYAELRYPGMEQVVFWEIGSGRRTCRRQYQAMMRGARMGLYRAVLAVESSRMWRNLRDALSEVQKLQEWGVDLVLWNAGIDTSTSVGRLQFAIIGALSQFESETISERTKRAFAENRRKGRRGPGRRPYGWIVGKEGILERDEREQRTADWAIAQREKGETWRGIAESLNQMGHRTAEGREWDPGGLRIVLRNLQRRRADDIEREREG